MSEREVAGYRARSGPGAATIALVAVVAVVYLTLGMDRTVNLFDEGSVLYGGMRVLHGAIPHRDFFTLYGPGQYYVLAALYRLFGPSVLVERAWDTVVRCGAVVLVFVIVRQVSARGPALAAAAASLVFLAAVGSYGYPVFPALLAVLAGFAFLAPAFGQSNPAGRLIAAGICAGIALLFRYDVGVGVFGAECVVLILAKGQQRLTMAARLGAVLRAVLLFGAGFAVIAVPLAVAYAVYRVIPDLIAQVIGYTLHDYAKMRSLPFPDLATMRQYPVSAIVYLPLVICAAAVPTMIAVARQNWKEATARDGVGSRPAPGSLLWALPAMVVLTLTLFGKGVVRVSAIHMAMALVASFALAGMLARPIPGRGIIGRAALFIALAAIVMLILPSVPTGLLEAIQNVAWLRNPTTWQAPAPGSPPVPGSCSMPAGLQRLACFVVIPAEMATALYVEQHTAPDDPIFVGLSRHDKIFVNDIFLYFAVDRPTVTKWYDFDPGLQTTAPIQDDMVRELQRAKPKLIVLEDIWADAREPNDSAKSSGVTVLDDYLRRTFEPVATFGKNTVLRPRPVAGQP